MTREEKENVLHCLRALIDEAVCEECNLYGTTGTDHCEADCVRLAIEALQTEHCEDCISRQAAISEIKKLYVKNPKTQDEYAYNDALDLADEMIHDMPSVSLQDVIRCSDCVHYAKSSGMCERNYNDKVFREMNFYCGFAKREMEEN